VLTLFLLLLDVQLRVYGPQHPEVLVTETTLAHTISEEGRYAEADKIQGFEVESLEEVAELGLISMRERLRLIGGHLSIESEQYHGTRIRVRIPQGAISAHIDIGA